MAEERRITAPLATAVYALAAFAALAAFGFFFPPVPEPLPPFRAAWRFFNSLVSYIALFPAISLSALAGSFGFASFGGVADERFEPRFMREMKPPLLTAIVAAAVYAALLLFVRPIALDAVSGMDARGSLFTAAAEKAAAALDEEEWQEAGGYLAVCERVWPDSPRTERSRERLEAGRAEARAKRDALRETPGDDGRNAFPGIGASLSANGALEASRKALGEGRLYDAHWLATFAERVSREGTPERAEAARLASDAWNEVSSTEPKRSDREAYSVFRQKRDGYAAVLAEDWIRAYYIYERLDRTVRNDPDVKRFLRASEEGTKTVSFFADEVGAFIGQVDFDVVLSVPREDGGRDVLRVERLHPFADAAYGEGLALLSFGPDGKFRFGLETDYLKLVPLRIERPYGEALDRAALLLLALDRDNEQRRWLPRWQGAKPAGPETRLVLDASYDALMLAARARKGVERLSIPDLNRAETVLPAFGFIAESFRAEIMRRVSEPFAFLSLAVFVLAISWRARARKTAGVAGGLFFLLILPFSMGALAQGYRALSMTVAALFAVAFPVSAAVAAVLVFQGILLLGALVFLAGQRA